MTPTQSVDSKSAKNLQDSFCVRFASKFPETPKNATTAINCFAKGVLSHGFSLTRTVHAATKTSGSEAPVVWLKKSSILSAFNVSFVTRF